MIWYDMIWYDMIWYDMIWYDTIRYDTIRYDTIRYDTIRYDTIRYDTIRYGTIRYDMIFIISYHIYDMIWLKRVNVQLNHLWNLHCGTDHTWNDLIVMSLLFHIIIIIIIMIIIILPYLSAHRQLSPYAQQIQTTIYNEKQYETNITKLIRNIKKISI